MIVSRTALNANVRALLHALRSVDALHSFHTTIGVASDNSLARALPKRVRETVLRRQVDLPESQIHNYVQRELLRLACVAGGWRTLTADSHGIFCSFKVGLDLDLAVSRKIPALARQNKIQAVYAFEDAACKTFEQAKQSGLTTIYELPIAYWQTSQRLHAEELERYPDWEPTLKQILDSPEKLAVKSEEIRLAEVIICPSKFVLDSIPAEIRSSARCVLAPFGSDTSIKQKVFDTTPVSARPLRVLFAGTLSQRKGLADVFEAFKLLDRTDVELIAIGSCVAPRAFYFDRFNRLHYESAKPREQLWELMRTCDVLILPSLVEGRALVVQEAMMCGLPVIITPNVGCEDLIVEGQSGFLVPIRSPEAIAEKLEWLASNRALIPELSRCARREAERVTWDSYGETILTAAGDAIRSRRN